MKNTSHPLEGAHILVINENQKLLRSMAFLMEIAGLQAVTASSADDVSQALTRQTPDLIVCDVDMISTDGYTMLRNIHNDRRFSHIPFIVTSQSYELHDLMYALDLGAADYLPKPFDVYDLLDAIREALIQPVAYRAAG
ncbi:MAG: response regulator [Anaerolineae bacterium]